jgi:hypothetical protein
MNSLLSHVLFKQNNRFLHKLWTLGEMASDMGTEYRMVVSHIDEGSNSSIQKDWEQLSSLQFDLTSSMRETTVVLKSFLVSLPGTEVESFRDSLVGSLAAASILADRRAVTFRRE